MWSTWGLDILYIQYFSLVIFKQNTNLQDLRADGWAIIKLPFNMVLYVYCKTCLTQGSVQSCEYCWFHKRPVPSWAADNYQRVKNRCSYKFHLKKQTSSFRNGVVSCVPAIKKSCLNDHSSKKEKKKIRRRGRSRRIRKGFSSVSCLLSHLVTMSAPLQENTNKSGSRRCCCIQ